MKSLLPVSTLSVATTQIYFKGEVWLQSDKLYTSRPACVSFLFTPTFDLEQHVVAESIDVFIGKQMRRDVLPRFLSVLSHMQF